WPGHLAGQHVDVRLTAEDGYQAQRSYSIASAPEAERLELTVEELPDGEVSPYLVEDAQVGDQFEVRGPIGGYFTWQAHTGGPPPAERPHSYVCGPTPFVEGAARLLVAAGHEPGRIRTERFGNTGG